MAERPCKASDTSSDDHPASILHPARQSPDRHPATPLPLTAPHKKGSLRIQSEGSPPFRCAQRRSVGRMDQFLKVRPLSSASIEIGFERSTSPARIRFERSLTT